MPIIRLHDLASPLLDPYRNLRTTNLTRHSGRFIAESKPLVQRLLQNDIAVESVLVDEKYLDEAIGWLPHETQIFVVTGDQVSELIGFSFHRGFLACGRRPSLETIATHTIQPMQDWMAVMMVGVQDPENMGSIFRTCAALGIRDVFLGPHCVDPFARRVLRVSMGNAFKLKYFDAQDSEKSIAILQSQGIDCIAAALTDRSIELGQCTIFGATVVIFGNEAHGLPASILNASNRSVRIAMELGTDSLNVSVAAGIMLHHLRRIARRANR